MGLNAPLRFGVLMENCGRAGPTVAKVAIRKAGSRAGHREGKKKKTTDSSMGVELEHVLIPASYWIFQTETKEQHAK